MDATLTIAPPPRALHILMRGARAKERGGQVHIEHRLPLGQRQLDRRLACHAPGVIDEHVNAAKRIGHACERVLHGGFVGDVDRKAVIRSHVEDRHACPRTLEHACGRRPDALRAACDDSGFSVETQHIHIAPGVNYTKSS